MYMYKYHVGIKQAQNAVIYYNADSYSLKCTQVVIAAATLHSSTSNLILVNNTEILSITSLHNNMQY